MLQNKFFLQSFNLYRDFMLSGYTMNQWLLFLHARACKNLGDAVSGAMLVDDTGMSHENARVPYTSESGSKVATVQYAESTSPSALSTAPTTMNSSTKKMFDQDNTSKPAGDQASQVTERAVVLFDLNAENLGTQD